MTVYKAEYVHDVWAMSTADGDKPTLIATTTRISRDDLNAMWAWLHAEATARGEPVHHFGHTSRSGRQPTFYAATTQDELEEAIR